MYGHLLKLKYKLTYIYIEPTSTYIYMVCIESLSDTKWYLVYSDTKELWRLNKEKKQPINSD